VDNYDMGEKVDKSLWTFSDMVFIPHILLRDAEPPVIEPVIIYVNGEALGEADVLFETAPVVPYEGYTAFSRIIDFAEVYDDELREKSRKRFKCLQDAGYRMRFIE
jgi:DNA polymerase IIIc chi subunit